MSAEQRAQDFNRIQHTLAKFISHVEDARTELRGQPAAKLAEFYAETRQYLDEVEALFKRFNLLKEEIKNTGLPEAFQREGLSTITTDSGWRVTISEVVRASMKDKEKGREWLEANGHGALIQPVVNASTLAALARELMGEGLELPDDVFNVLVQSNASLTKVKKGVK